MLSVRAIEKCAKNKIIIRYNIYKLVSISQYNDVYCILLYIGTKRDVGARAERITYPSCAFSCRPNPVACDRSKNNYYYLPIILAAPTTVWVYTEKCLFARPVK